MRFMKKDILIELDEIPTSNEWIVIEVERYCIKEKLEYEVIKTGEEPIMKIANKMYRCKLKYGGRVPAYINCLEIE